MSKKPDGGNAFPITPHPDSGAILEYGMSLRDYFAGQAMLALIAGHHQIDTEKYAGRTVGDVLAERAYSYADFMIAERSK